MSSIARSQKPHLGPIYRETSQLDHDMALRLEDMVDDMAWSGATPAEIRASILRVLGGAK